MLNDRFGKLMLMLIAVLLAANLFRGGSKAELVLPIESSANAQSTVTSNQTPARKLVVKVVQGFSVSELKSVVPVGDGKSFVVSNDKGFMVYTVEPQQQQ